MGRQLELAYQAGRASNIGQVSPTPDYIIERYRRCRWWRLFPKECLFKYLENINQKDILDFGCGEGRITTQLARLGGYVTAMDISPELIEIAKRRANLDGVQDRIQFIIGDITGSPLPNNKFDFVVCNEVLHHVDICSILPRLIAYLKPGGIAIIVEPIAFSPLLQRFRNMLPVSKDVSPDERQLNKNDVDFILKHFVDSRVTFFNLFGRLSRLFPNRNKIDKGHSVTKAFLILLGSIDHFLLTFFPFLSRSYGVAVIIGQKPFYRNHNRKS